MPARERSSWPAAPHDPGDAYGYTPLPAARIPPGPKAISELDRILPWLGTLETGDRRIVWARAAGLSWARLAREFGISVGQARYRWNGAIDLVVAAAVRDTIETGAAAALRPKLLPNRPHCALIRTRLTQP